MNTLIVLQHWHNINIKVFLKRYCEMGQPGIDLYNIYHIISRLSPYCSGPLLRVILSLFIVTIKQMRNAKILLKRKQIVIFDQPA